MFYFLKSFLFSDSYHQAKHDFYQVFLKELELINKYSDIEIDDSIRILIYGCGYNFPDVFLFSSTARNTYGIDVQEVFYRDGLKKLVNYNRKQELSFISSFLRALYIRRRYTNYHKHLSSFIEKEIEISSLKIQSVKDNHFPFPNEYFDIILSNAVLEHVINIPKSINELYRITNKGGISIHLLHNFYSLSGAHVPENIYTKNPWGHLLGNKKFEEYLEMSKTYLNKVLPNTLKDELKKASFKLILHCPADINHNIEGLDTDFQFEGENILKSSRNLTDKDRKILLSLYSRDELLSRAFVYVCQK